MDFSTDSEYCYYLAAIIDGEGHIETRQGKNVYIINTDYDVISKCIECLSRLYINYKLRCDDYGFRRLGHKKIWRLRIAYRSNLEKIYNSVPIKHPKKINDLLLNIQSYGKRARITVYENKINIVDLNPSLHNMAAYMAGMLDGEGCVSLSYGKKVHRTIDITNTEYALIDVCSKYLSILGIKYCIEFRNTQIINNRPCWRIRIESYENIKKFYEMIPIQIFRKSEKLKNILSSYIRANITKQIPQSELIRLYIDNRKSIKEMADIFHCSYTFILNRMIEYSIPRRASYDAENLDWRKRHANEIAGSKSLSLDASPRSGSQV